MFWLFLMLLNLFNAGISLLMPPIRDIDIFMGVMELGMAGLCGYFYITRK